MGTLPDFAMVNGLEMSLTSRAEMRWRPLFLALSEKLYGQWQFQMGGR